ESGANRKPTQKELTNWSGFLGRTIELVNPPGIVKLGSGAFEAPKRIQYHELSLKTAAGEVHLWNDRVLVPIYHPGPQVLASHRLEAEQLADYQIWAEDVTRAHAR